MDLNSGHSNEAKTNYSGHEKQATSFINSHEHYAYTPDHDETSPLLHENVIRTEVPESDDNAHLCVTNGCHGNHGAGSLDHNNGEGPGDLNMDTNRSNHVYFESTNIKPERVEKRQKRKRAFDLSNSIASKLVDSQAYLLSTLSHSVYADDHFSGDVTCSNTQTLMNLIKNQAGAGCLSLPIAFKYAGLWVGFGLFLFISMIGLHCTHVLVRCSTILEKRNSVTFLINIMQCGFCSIYIVFVASNVKKVVDQYWTNSPDVRVYMTLTYLGMLPYMMVKRLKTLATFSIISNLFFLVGFVIIYQYIFQDLPDTWTRPTFSSWTTLPLFIGTAFYFFEGISLVIPLRSVMKHPEDYEGFGGVLSMGVVLSIAFYTATGFYGYLRFGDDVASTMTLNLPQGQWLYLSVDLMFAVVGYLSMAMQFYVPINTIWPFIERKLRMTSQGCKTVMEFLVRVGLLSFVFMLAIIVPHLDLLMSLLGAFFGTFLIMIIPPIMEMLTLYEDQGLSAFSVFRNLCICLIGIIGFATGTYASLVEIINTF